MRRIRKRYALSVAAAGYLTYWSFCLPAVVFTAPLATELLSAEGRLLAARIAADGQWRMPAADSTADALELAVIAYEDRRFYDHWGVSVTGILRAAIDNWRAGRIVSGGSTLTMQVARMARGNRARTLVQKLVEASWATRLEFRYSKDELLELWLANAPFGGNVVGAEAAARRYYGRPPDRLSWAEAATLAVLPNSPGLIHPGRDRAALRAKRDGLLDDMVALGHLDAAAAELAKLEPLPEVPRPHPRLADHLLERLRRAGGPGRYRSTLEADLQQRVNELVADHQQNLARNRVFNVACMVSEVATGKVVAYVGNVPNLAPAYAPNVDLVTAPRSPGSLLKPILYALAQEDGTLAARQLLPDVPTSFGSFRPANFYLDYDGAVPADEALARSLNVPFVHLLRDYGNERFHAQLQGFGFGQIDRPAPHYGLSMILGGGEITMEEIHGWFLGLARQQRFFYDRQGRYNAEDWKGVRLLNDKHNENHTPDHRRRPRSADLAKNDRPPARSTAFRQQAGPIGAGAGFTTLEALRELQRPDENGNAVRFASRRPVAWKTGTSFGFRDAWAVGCTPAYVVSVWAGNANGEGRPGLVGVKAAAPLLFGVFRLLEDRSASAPRWFDPPYHELAETVVCRVSGHLAGQDCPADTRWLPPAVQRSAVCPYHERLFLGPDRRFRVYQDCGPDPARSANWFTLPVRQAYYYRRKHADYRHRPPLHPACGTDADATTMVFVFPYRDGVISPGKSWKGGTEPVPFELAHPRPETTVHWHLDGAYLGATTTFHTLTVPVSAGRHALTVVDEDGGKRTRSFEVR